MICKNCKYFQKKTGAEGKTAECSVDAGKTYIVWDDRPACDCFNGEK